MIKKIFSIFVVLLSSIALFHSCNQDYSPKPQGYLRIDLPAHQYTLFDSLYPFGFQYSSHAFIEADQSFKSEKYWLDIIYPSFNAKIHMSYKAVDQNLNEYFEDARVFVNKHMPKASNINEIPIINSEKNVYGLVFDIRGTGAASPYQFYLTDSSSHFVRGALYFNTKPNNDSLRPVIDFIVEDIYTLIEKFEWKEL